MPSLDAQPWPDRERIDIPRYLRHGATSWNRLAFRDHGARLPLPLQLVQSFRVRHTHRRRSPQAVAEEVEWLLALRPDMLWIADDVFTIHHGWLFEYAAELKKRGIQIPFECITRADRLNEKVVETLREIG